jgi:hypothetical protein
MLGSSKKKAAAAAKAAEPRGYVGEISEAQAEVFANFK